jgi:hypothetical protein
MTIPPAKKKRDKQIREIMLHLNNADDDFIEEIHTMAVTDKFVNHYHDHDFKVMIAREEDITH